MSISVKKIAILFLLTEFFLIFIDSYLVYAAKANSSQSHWSYQGNFGPTTWGKTNNDFKICYIGKKQSPIDIQIKDINKSKNLSSLKFYSFNNSLNILNNGHTIQVNFKKGNKLFVENMSYDLLQLHFHHPSEHEINGKRSDMEIHLVYKNMEGNFAVVAIMVNKGEKNSLLSDLFDNFPSTENTNQTLENIKINPIDFLPQDRNYYKYIGSLTTPPCSENVTWYILQNSIEISSNQLQNFTKIFKMNARPPQALNNRSIQEKI